MVHAGARDLSAPAEPATPAEPAAPAQRGRRTGQLVLLAGYLITGLAVTWPRVSYLWGRLPNTRDVGGYVWDFWWVAHQLTHLSSPWATSYLAAPVGSSLGYHTLMPLPAALMTPVTLAFGPSASYNLLSILCPGVLCYLMYRAARLWLRTQFGAIAAGAFFGISPVLAWRSWYELNLALGALFLPLALEAAVRLRRGGQARAAVALGAALGAALLTDQESAVLAVILAGLVLLPGLLRRAGPARGGDPPLRSPGGLPPEPPAPGRRFAPRARWPRLRQVALATVTAAAVASPQLVVMIQQAAADRIPASRGTLLATNYVTSGAALQQLFAPSPRVAEYGLTAVSRFYYQGPYSMAVVTFGAVLTALALFGTAVCWRRRTARSLALLLAGCAALSLGSELWIGRHGYLPFATVVHGVRVSMIMPFTWFVRIPGLADFREANRFTELGLVPAALLAGAAVEWLRAHARAALFPVLTLAVLEAGWPGNPGIGTMPTALPRLDGPIAAQHTASIVVDVPFGIRGGLPVIGGSFPAESLVLATADQHPLADAFISRIPASTLAGIEHNPFYAALLNAQGGHHRTTAAQFTAAAASARRMNVGWVLVWQQTRPVLRMLRLAGFRSAYQADGVRVYRR
jgi:4-amino-4-deoxy-L-arabinose transferase-like glycosyltransferase